MFRTHLHYFIVALIAATSAAKADSVSGALDTSFGQSGMAALPPGPQLSLRMNMRVLADARIQLAFGTSEAPDRLAIHRLLPNGTPDASYRGGVVTYLSVPSALPLPKLSAFPISPDGSVFAIGQSGADVIVGHILPSGAVDPGFGSGGWLRTNGLDASHLQILHGELSSDGYLICGRELRVGMPATPYVLNLNTDLTQPYNKFLPLAIVADGRGAAETCVEDSLQRVVMAGSGPTPQSSGLFSWMQARIDKNSGQLDSTFGADQPKPGVVLTDMTDGSSSAAVVAMTRDSSGRIVSTGSVTRKSTAMRPNDVDFGIKRQSADGIPDAFFGIDADGSAILSFDIAAPFNDTPRAIAVQSGKKTLVAGSTTTVAGAPTLTGLSLARFGDDGLLDQGFGTNGKVVHALTQGFGQFDAAGQIIIGLQGNQPVIATVAGSSFQDRHIVVVRLFEDVILSDGFD